MVSTHPTTHNCHLHVPLIFQFTSKVKVLILLFTFLCFFFLGSAGTTRSTICKFSFFWLIIIRPRLLASIMWSVCLSKSHRSLCVSFSKTDAGLCIYHLFIWSNFNFLHISQWITLSNLSCLVLYPFCVNLLYSLIMWLRVSSLSSHNQHLLFCCVFYTLTLIWLVLITLFCAAMRRVFVSLLRFPFLSDIHVFSCETLFISRLNCP